MPPVACATTAPLQIPVQLETPVPIAIPTSEFQYSWTFGSEHGPQVAVGVPHPIDIAEPPFATGTVPVSVTFGVVPPLETMGAVPETEDTPPPAPPPAGLYCCARAVPVTARIAATIAAARIRRNRS